MSWKTLDDMALAGARVLTRVDINVPMEAGRVTDTTRIDRTVPTIRDIRAAGGSVILLAHFGRPKGTVVPEMSLAPLIPALEAAYGLPVRFVGHDGVPGDMAPGEIVLLENTRFYAGEEKNDPKLAENWARMGDIYCNDAFSAAHRAHASTAALARLRPACAGRLMAAELTALEAALGSPARPVAALVGGAKVSTKLDLLGNLVSKVDHLIIGGGMANTFLAAKGIDVGRSLAEHEMTGTARDILDKAEAVGCAVLLPIDIVVAREFREGAESETLHVSACPEDAMILDVGPKTVDAVGRVISEVATMVWNGPLGAFEIAPFDTATVAAAKLAARETGAGRLVSVAGGGDTVAALNHAGVATDFTYVSTAGGAFLEWMEGKTLPGVAALDG